MVPRGVPLNTFHTEEEETRSAIRLFHFFCSSALVLLGAAAGPEAALNCHFDLPEIRIVRSSRLMGSHFSTLASNRSSRDNMLDVETLMD